jgi:hypothetical protein
MIHELTEKSMEILEDLMHDSLTGVIELKLMKGSMKNALKLFVGAVRDVVQSIASQGSVFSDKFGLSVCSLVNRRKERAPRLIQNAFDALAKLRKFDKTLNAITLKNAMPLQRFANLTNRLVQDGVSDSKVLAEFGEKFTDIVQLRNRTTKERFVLRKSAQASIKTYCASIRRLSRCQRKEGLKFLELLDLLSRNYAQLGEAIVHGTIDWLKSESSIDFYGDFSRFVRDKEIVRREFAPGNFIPFDVSSPAFNGVKCMTSFGIPFSYPIGIAITICDWKSTSKEQLAFTKGRYFLVLEEGKKNWTFVMNPVSAKRGFVPSAALKRIGEGFGVLRRKETGIGIGTSDFVAVLDETTNDYVVETVSGRDFVMPKEMVQVIY